MPAKKKAIKKAVKAKRPTRKAKRAPAKRKAKPRSKTAPRAKRSPAKAEAKVEPRTPKLPKGALLRVDWNPENEKDVAAADRIFHQHKGKRRPAHKITKDGRRGTRLRQFVPECGSMAVYAARNAWDRVRENAK